MVYIYTSIQIQNTFCSAYFNLFIEFIFFLCFLESSFFRLFTLNPHDTQVNSYSYSRRVFRLQCPHFLAFFSIISFSVNSIY